MTRTRDLHNLNGRVPVVQRFSSIRGEHPVLANHDGDGHAEFAPLSGVRSMNGLDHLAHNRRVEAWREACLHMLEICCPGTRQR